MLRGFDNAVSDLLGCSKDARESTGFVWSLLRSVVEKISQYKELTALYGRIVYMAMRTNVYKSYTLSDFDRLFIPPILLGQYYTLDHDDFLLGFTSWANLTEEAETGFLNRTRKLQPNDWNAGDHSRIWFIDCLAPWGGVTKMIRHISRALREKADANNWPAKRARWTRTYGDGIVKHVGMVTR